MNLFKQRGQSASSLPSEDNFDTRLQDALQQAYTVEGVSPALRQRISELAAFHEQQTVMQKPKRSRLHFALTLGSIICLLCFLSLFSLCVRFYTIPSMSMEPTLIGHDAGSVYDGVFYNSALHDIVAVNTWAYQMENPQYGDIVAFIAPTEADAEHKYLGRQREKVLVKRIIGVPGDTIEIKGGRVYRRGKLLIEPYIKEPMDPNLESNYVYGSRLGVIGSRDGLGGVTLYDQQYWVMGDNRNDSNDSRYWGPLVRGRIIGKVTQIIAPYQRWRSFP